MPRTLYGQLLALTSVVLAALVVFAAGALFLANALHAQSDTRHLMGAALSSVSERLSTRGPAGAVGREALSLLKSRRGTVMVLTPQGRILARAGAPLPAQLVQAALARETQRLPRPVWWQATTGRALRLVAVSPVYVPRTGELVWVLVSAVVRPSPPSLRTLTALFAAAGLALILAQALWSVVLRRFTRPVEDMTLWAQRLAAGDLRSPLPAGARGGTVELRRLADALERMARTLLAEGERREAFLAEVAHDLRTPLSVQRTLLGHLAQEPDLAQIRELARRAQRETERLIRLVNGLLDLARAELGQDPGATRRLDLAEAVAVAVLPFDASAQEKGVHLAFRTPEGRVWARADSDRVAQIVTNLVDNALRFTPPGGSVTVEVGFRGPQAVVRVLDTGPGVPPDERSRIWERFAQGKAGGHEGAGLGLAISRALARAMGGELELLEGPGGRFELRLPRA